MDSKMYLGPEDPRITLMPLENNKIEPLIVFNMRTLIGRSMHSIFPLRKPIDESNRYKVTEYLMRGHEDDTGDKKNWIPFFSKETQNSKGNSTTENQEKYVDMIFQINPLTVFKCGLDSGLCDIQQENHKGAENVGDGFFLRGGSDFVPLPKEIVDYIKFESQSEDLEMWLTFSKTHVEHCGCGKKLYRPVLTILVKQNGIYHIDYLSDSIDFGTSIKAWDNDFGNCGVANVLNPNSIAFWEIESLEPLFSNEGYDIPHFSDYMGLTVSEADSNVKIVLIKNILNYIVGTYGVKKRFGGYELKQHRQFEQEAAEDKSARLSQCMLRFSRLYCLQYGLEHPEGEPDN